MPRGGSVWTWSGLASCGSIRRAPTVFRPTRRGISPGPPPRPPTDRPLGAIQQSSEVRPERPEEEDLRHEAEGRISPRAGSFLGAPGEEDRGKEASGKGCGRGIPPPKAAPPAGRAGGE